MRRFVLLFINFFPALLWAQSAEDTLKNTILSATQLTEDFGFYRRVLQETHPGLYRYTPRGKMQSKLDSISTLLESPMSFYDFYRILAALNADIRCAHSSALPAKDINNYMRSTAKMLPLFLYPAQQKFYVIFNGTSDQRLKPGFEVTHINDHPIDSLADILSRHFWSDGYIELSKNQVLQGGVFNLFYYTIVERPDTFNLTLINPQGEKEMFTVAAQTLAATDKSYLKNSVNKEMLKFYNQKHKKPWRLDFPADAKSSAILRFDAFGGKGMNSEEKAKIAIRKFMDNALLKIEKKKSRYLIVDLRTNSGGWDVQGVELLTYLLKSDTPIRYYERLHAITNDSEFLAYSDLSEEDQKNIPNKLKLESDGTFTLREEENENLKLQYPKPNRFRGKVYILMDERSFSTASEFLAVAKSNEIGVFIGEESGGAYEGGNGSSFVNFTLPNSMIAINTPLVYYQNAVKPTQPRGRGTMPDFNISIKPEDLLEDYDRQLEFVKELIRKENE